MKRAKVKIYGIVQGVFFRANTKGRANRLNVNGYVRNMPDGTVEAVFEGEDEAVDAIVQWCKKGPRGARVDRVEVSEERYKGEFDDFRIRYW